MNGKVIELGLALPQSGHAEVAGLRSIIDRSFVLLGDWLTAFGDADHDNLAGRLDACRTALADGLPVEELEALAGPCLHAGKSIVTQIQLQQLESRNEMSTLITIVREAVEAVATENKDLHVSLQQSTERFAAVAELNNLHQIKSKSSPRCRCSGG